MTALFYGLQITYEWRQSLSIPPNRFNYLPTSDINVLDSWWDGLTVGPMALPLGNQSAAHQSLSRAVEEGRNKK